MPRFIKDYLWVIFLAAMFPASFFLSSTLGGIPFRQLEGALPGVLTATVSINPLFVMFLPPDNPIVDKPFTLELKIENRGEVRIEDLKVKPHLPNEISLLGGREERNVGVLPGYREKTISWHLKTSKIGSYVIAAYATGKVSGTKDTISSNDSIVVDVGNTTPKTGNFPFPLLKYLQMLLNMLQ